MASVYRFFFVILFLAGIFSSSRAQYSTDTTHHSFSRKRLNTVIIGSAAAYTGSMVVLSQAWYKDAPHQSFHFFNDAREWKQMDKLGHFYSAFQLSSIATHTFRWSGVSKNKSENAASLTSMGIMSSIEVFDGFSAAYGASLSDLAANATGAAFYWGQQKLWNEVRIYPKYSFHRTSFAPQRPNVLGDGLSQELLKDYNGQSYWFSIDADKFFRFPKWINIAVGYGAEEMVSADDAANRAMQLNPYRQYYLSLDLDLTAFHSRSKLLNALIYFTNMIRLPAPALEFSRKGVRAHALYF